MKENTEQLSSEEKQYRKMTEEPVCRLIMKLGLPTTISMLITIWSILGLSAGLEQERPEQLLSCLV